LTYGEAYGGAAAGEPSGYAFADQEAFTYYFLTNNSQTDSEYVGFEVSSYATSAASADRSTDYGESFALSYFYDEDYGYAAYGYSESLSGTDSYSVWYGAFDGVVETSGIDGEFAYPTPVSSSEYVEGEYYTVLAPGQTDILWSVTYGYEEGYAKPTATPSPAAVAPFALSLLAAVRRRRRKP
jgi:MYXO-CTERM domain-containing protein